jgi:hypothetical protein
MKSPIIKVSLGYGHILLLSSFQTFAEELRITTADVSTPENTDKTIELSHYLISKIFFFFSTPFL